MKSEIIRKVCANIPTGREHAIHQLELADRLGLKPTTLKKIIQQARKQNIPVLSSSDGYWIAESREEIAAFASMMHKQGVSRLASIKGMNNMLRQAAGQTELFESMEGNEQ